VIRKYRQLSGKNKISKFPQVGKMITDSNICHTFVDTLAACSLAICGLRTRPRTDVDPPRVELPYAGTGHIVSPPGDDNLFTHTPV